MEKYILGIDVGTTGTKTLLFSESGKLCASAYQGYPLHTPEVGYSEQAPEDWWDAIKKTISEVCKAGNVGENVEAISLSTQGGTVVPTDKEGNPLRPSIVWNDARAKKERALFLEEVGDDATMYGLSGWHLGKGLPALLIRWLRDNEPEIFEKTDLFLTVPDYVALKMTGIPAVDFSNAGINQLCDIQKKAYDAKILDFCGIREEQLPKLVASGEAIGHLTEKAAKELGLSTETILVSGAHDQYAVALGAGATAAGDILIGSGTCWVVTAIGDAPDFSSGLSQSVAAVPNMWGSLQSLSSGGVCLDWLRKNITPTAEMTYQDIDAETAKRKAAEDGLFFYPFTGKANAKERLQRASFVGLDLSHDKFDMALAVMEGVVFQVLWMMEAFRQKPSKEGIILAGGASKSPVWAKLLADISGLPVRIPAVADLACVGAAILAGVGGGIYRDAAEGYRKLAVGESVLEPNAEKTKIYAPLFDAYKKKAAALK